MSVSPKQERTPIRTFEQLLRRYDLEAIASIKIATENVTIGLNKTNTTVEEFVTATIGTLENMQNQIDGNISTWFYKGAPTLNNTPANEWATIEEKDAHLGDLYYDQDTGYGYRFSVTNGDYNWIKLTDNDVVEALAIANAAQDTADGKRRVFTDTPSPPYDVGDLWFKEKEIYICRAPKSAGSKYESDDFGIATKYTDDTKANEVANDLAKNYSTTVEVNSAISKSASEILVNIAATYTTKNELTNEIAALEEQYTAVSLKADGLETTVKSHTTQIGDLSTRVTSTESSITQHAKEIDLRVKSDSVIAAINLTSETALIAAKHIDLVGAVTFSSLDSSTQSKINTASTNASNAVSTANTASTTANTANTNATNALNRATYHYGTCGTAAATAAKAVTLSGFSLYTGAMVSVYFTYANTAASPTLNVNGTGAKSIRVNNAVITAKYYWRAGDTVTFIYNGTYWVLADTSANSILASWCSDNDRTLIDGGKIYASEAFLQNIFSKNITATGTITGLGIISTDGTATGTITLDNGHLIVGNPNGINMGMGNAGINWNYIGVQAGRITNAAGSLGLEIATNERLYISVNDEYPMMFNESESYANMIHVKWPMIFDDDIYPLNIDCVNITCNNVVTRDGISLRELNSNLPIIYITNVLVNVSNKQTETVIYFDQPFSDTSYTIAVCPIGFMGAWTNVRWEIGGKTTHYMTLITYGENSYQYEGWFDIIAIGK